MYAEYTQLQLTFLALQPWVRLCDLIDSLVLIIHTSRRKEIYLIAHLKLKTYLFSSLALKLEKF